MQAMRGANPRPCKQKDFGGNTMYILFERTCSYSDDGFYPCGFCDYDAMGYAVDEETAIRWVDENDIYRRYKFCPDEQIYAPLTQR